MLGPTARSAVSGFRRGAAMRAAQNSTDEQTEPEAPGAARQPQRRQIVLTQCRRQHPCRARRADQQVDRGGAAPGDQRTTGMAERRAGHHASVIVPMRRRSGHAARRSAAARRMSAGEASRQNRAAQPEIAEMQHREQRLAQGRGAPPARQPSPCASRRQAEKGRRRRRPAATAMTSSVGPVSASTARSNMKAAGTALRGAPWPASCA